jgi:DNA-binding transcriptional regulator YiaG
MAGHKHWRTLLKNASPERLAKIKANTDQQLAEISVSELRRTQNVTQAELAKRLNISQPALSQSESQSDMYLSSLRKIVEALGGNVEIVVRLKDEKYRLNL